MKPPSRWALNSQSLEVYTNEDERNKKDSQYSGPCPRKSATPQEIYPSGKSHLPLIRAAMVSVETGLCPEHILQEGGPMKRDIPYASKGSHIVRGALAYPCRWYNG